MIILIQGAMKFVCFDGYYEGPMTGESQTLASLAIPLVPAMIFTVICFKCKEKTQLKAVHLFTVYYSFCMIIVIILMVTNWVSTKTNQCPQCESHNMFLYMFIAVYSIAAVLHPQEAYILVCGVVYLVFLPTTFILLNIYSFANLNVMRWGTREGKNEKTEGDEVERTKKRKSWIPNINLNLQIGVDDVSQNSSSLANNYSGDFQSRLHHHGSPLLGTNKNSTQFNSSTLSTHSDSDSTSNCGRSTLLGTNVPRKPSKFRLKVEKYDLGKLQSIQRVQIVKICECFVIYSNRFYNILCFLTILNAL